MNTNDDQKESFATHPGWRWNFAVIALFFLALAFLGLALVLVIDSNWAYQVLAPQK
ncbi:hypothetical protein LG204_05775 [Methylovorus menthalis]|nr:hypothetical protein [Methylovorus menthalis]